MTINMSYCRFQNTLLAVKECAGDLGDMIEGRGEPLSREERKACVELAEEMIEFLRMLDESSGGGLSDDEDIRVGDLDCSSDRIENAVDCVCAMAGSEHDEDEPDDDGFLGSILECPTCCCGSKCVKVNTANMRHADPTETYTLECGHTII